jgi:hypothetical protein
MRGNIPSVIRLIVALFFLSILPAQVCALTPAQVFDMVKESVVVVWTLDSHDERQSQGSGVLLPSGKIATNCHVVGGGDYYQVGRGNNLVRAILYSEDRYKDICLLEAKGVIGKPAQLGKATSLKVGSPVYAVGAPKGLELSLSDGIVAQLRGGPPPYIQTTAAISPGSSGGGLFDEEGQLVGLTTFQIEGGQSLNFAIPAEWVGKGKPGRKSSVARRGQVEWLKRAEALEESNDMKGLLDWCRTWTSSEPEDYFAWITLGNTYILLKRYHDAIDAYHRAINLNPEYADALHGLGIAYYELTRYNEAIDVFRQALRLDPKNASLLYCLGTAYAGTGNRLAALEVAKELRSLDPARADKLINEIRPR